MKVVLDFYYDDLEKRCAREDCGAVIVGPYSEDYRSNLGCPKCGGHRFAYFRAFGTLEQRSKPVQRSQARISGIDY